MKKLFLIFVILMASFGGFCQGVGVFNTGVGISLDSTFTPDPSAILDISSDSQGILIPRMDSATIHGISLPAKGLMAYDTTGSRIWIYSGTEWKAVSNLWDKTDTTLTTELRVGIRKDNPVMSLDCNGNIDINSDSSYCIGTLPMLRSTGTNNLFVGPFTGDDITTGQASLFVGQEAGKNTTSGSYNVFLGYGADSSNLTGNYKVSIGYLSGVKDTTSYNTWVGAKAGQNARGYYNASFGFEAHLGNTTTCTGTYNSIVGYKCGRSISTGSYNAMAGYAGYNNTSGSGNVFFGHSCGNYNTTGGYNVCLGFQSGYSSSTSSYSVKIGLYSGRYFTGAANVMIGSAAGQGVSGSSSGIYNTFLGYQTGYSTTSAGYNTFVGSRSGFNHTTGGANVYAGYEAGYNTTTGENNVMLGYQAGRSSGSGTAASRNVFVGFQAGYSETGSDKLYIENSSAASTSALIYGEFNNDYLRFNADVSVKDEFAIDQSVQTSLTGTPTVSTGQSYVLVKGDTSAVTLNSTTPLAAGAYTGQLLILQGNDNTHSVTIGNSGNVKLSAAVTLGNKDTIVLIWDGTYWVESSRSNN